MILFSGIFLVVIGGVIGYQLANFPKVALIHQNKAIQQYFDVKSNEYTYIPEGVDDYYILSVQDKEYRIKFSMNKPTTIAYSEELSGIEE